MSVSEKVRGAAQVALHPWRAAREAVETFRGFIAVLGAMSEAERPVEVERPAQLRELAARPPPRPRPVPAPPRVRRKTLAPAAPRIARPKVKRGQKHR